MIRSYKTEGIIIKRRNFAEADRILTVFSLSNGKIQVKAPGVRKITSRRSSQTETLNLSILTLYKSFHTSLPIVTEAQTLEEFRGIKNSLKKIGFAYYICELIDGLCPLNQENKRVFFLTKNILLRLSNSFNNEAVVKDFEDEFLLALGFLPRKPVLQDKEIFIENILERKLATKRLLPLFL